MKSKKPGRSVAAVVATAAFEALEGRQMFANIPPVFGPVGLMMPYVKGQGDSRTFAVVYTDADAPLDRSSLTDDDIEVYGPNDFNAYATVVGIARSKPGEPVMVRYRITGVPADGTTYNVALLSTAVTDTLGRQDFGGTIGRFRVAPNGDSTPLPPQSETPPQPPPPPPQPSQPSIVSQGIAVGSLTNPARPATGFGQLLVAAHLGTGVATPLPANDGSFLPLVGAPVSGPTNPQVVVSNPVTITVSSSSGGPLANRNLSTAPPGYEAEIVGDPSDVMYLKVAGLDPAKTYRIQYLHAEIAGGPAYMPTPQYISLPTGESVQPTLAFNTSPSNATAIVTVIVTGTAAVTYAMPPGASLRPPGFSSVVVEVASQPPTPPTPPAPPQPVAPQSATFVRGSIRIVGSGQSFDIAYANPAGGLPVTAVQLALEEVLVAGPRGLTARGVLVGSVPTPDGKMVATYRIEGVDMTGRHVIRVNGRAIASPTLFYLKPIIWDAPTGGSNTDGSNTDDGGSTNVVAGKRNVKREVVELPPAKAHHAKHHKHHKHRRHRAH
jgi:hypothetical protein